MCTRYLRSKQRGSSLIDIYVKNLRQLRKFFGREKRSNGLSSTCSIESNSPSSMESGNRESVAADARWSLIRPGDSNRAVVAAFKAWFVAFLALGSKMTVVLIMMRWPVNLSRRG
ncbi:hypothetical protein L1887_05475 [Cichorium endivia]|nr:hypothetical protein L1887_05475 [Cichorium endivia]